jgi:hypothetical protein
LSSRKRQPRGIDQGFDFPSSSSTPFPSKTTGREPISLEGYQFNLTEDAIFAEANEHEKFDIFRSYSIGGLPRFDDLSLYGVTEIEQKRLLKLEIKRLVKDATSETPFLFNSQGGFDQATAKSYAELSNLADQILIDCAIVLLDNVATIITHDPSAEVIEICAYHFKQGYSMLKHHYGEKHARQRIRLPEPPERSRKLYFAIVDYASSCVARLLIRTAASAQWNHMHLALLAQYSVKLKFLSHKSAAFAKRSMENADSVIAQFEYDREAPTIITKLAQVEGKGMEEKQVQVSPDDDPSMIYYMRSLVKRGVIEHLMKTTLSSLFNSTVDDRLYEDIHHYAVAYETGFERSHVVVSENREGDVSTTSSPAFVRTCCHALRLVQVNIDQLKKEISPPKSYATSEDDIQQCLITLDWSVRQKGTNEPVLTSTQLSTTNLDNVISTVMPLALSTPFVSSNIEDLVHFISSHTMSEVDEPMGRFRHPRLRAKCAVQTSANLAWQERVNLYDTDTVSIGECGIFGKLRGKWRANLCFMARICDLLVHSGYTYRQ